jgi:aminopeptidase YwaD
VSQYKMKSPVILFISLIFLLRPGVCQKKNMSHDELLKALADEVAGEEAFQNVVALAGWPRIRTEDEYTGTFNEAAYVLGKLKEYGLEKAQIEYFPWEFQNWAPVEAELWLIEPDRQMLTSLDLVPLCLIQDSKCADVQAELIEVGEGTLPKDYQGKDVRGKLVLSSGYEVQVNHEAVNLRGALGIISCRGLLPDDQPDNVAWASFSQLIRESPEKYSFGFMISPRQGRRLRGFLDEGKKVLVKAQVKTQLYPGKLDVVSALIPGTERPGEEILLMAHLFEFYYMQGANDNSSGSAAILEAARAIAILIKDGRLAPPRRSIRFFWEPEGFGTFAYLAKYPDAKSRFKAVIDMDMVGEGHRQCGAVFEVLVTPDSLPHFFGDIVSAMAQDIKVKSGYGRRTPTESFAELMASPTGSRDPFYCEIIHFNPRPYNENWLSIPHILFHCGPDPFYHSMEDRPDKCDPTQLKRAALLGAAAAYCMADLGPEDVPGLSSLVLAGAEDRLAKDKKRALDLLERSEKATVHQNHKEALNIIRHGLGREHGALGSIGTYLGLSEKEADSLRGLLGGINPALYASIENYYAFLCDSLNFRKSKPSPTAQETRLGKLIPRRLIGLEYSADFDYLERTLGDPDIQKKISINQAGFTARWEALNFVDGKRSVTDIRDALSAEFSPVPITLEMVEQYLRILEKAGVVSLE